MLKKWQKGSTHFMMLLVGTGFLAFTLLPYLLPGTFTTDSSPLVSILTGLIGLAAIIFGVLGLRKVFTEKLDDMNYFDQVSKTDFDPKLVQEVSDSTEPLKDYYFHYCGKLNQSYILETVDRQPVIEINCDKIGLVNDYVFTFINHLTGKQWTSNVSHTITTSYGGDDVSIIDKSYFNIDGQNIWEYIAERGYGIDPYLESLAWSFDVNHYGVKVADLKAAGTNILPAYEGKQGLRDVAMSFGLFRVSCRESDAEAVAIIAFAASRVQII